MAAVKLKIKEEAPGRLSTLDADIDNRIQKGVELLKGNACDFD